MLKIFRQEVGYKVTANVKRKSQRNKIPNLIVEKEGKKGGYSKRISFILLFSSQKQNQG